MLDIVLIVTLFTASVNVLNIILVMKSLSVIDKGFAVSTRL